MKILNSFLGLQAWVLGTNVSLYLCFYKSKMGEMGGEVFVKTHKGLPHVNILRTLGRTITLL